MGAQDYSSTGGGLKLKGSKPSGVEKKKKKKTSTSLTSSTKDTTTDASSSSTFATRAHAETDAPDVSQAKSTQGEESEDHEAAAREELNAMYKTETERRHEEMKKRRLNDRLRREGAKTHKERVEELNKYLSGLSEHHDMPRIGPG